MVGYHFAWDDLDHPPYSLDFVPRNFHLFQYFENDLGGKHFNQIRLILWPYYVSKVNLWYFNLLSI